MREGIWAIIEASRGGAQPPRTLSTCSSSKNTKAQLCRPLYTLLHCSGMKNALLCIIVFQISLLCLPTAMTQADDQYQWHLSVSQLRFILALCQTLALSKMIRNHASRSIVEIWHLLRRFFIGTVITSKMITWRRNNDQEHYFWWREKNTIGYFGEALQIVVSYIVAECAFVTSGGTMGQVLLKRCLYVSTGEI